MDKSNKSETFLARKKVLPSLGGIRKKYLRKSKILKTTLEFLGQFLEQFGKELQLKNIEKEAIKNFSINIRKLGNLERYNQIDFYNLCQNIIQKYNE